jgi:hypothetical protein
VPCTPPTCPACDAGVSRRWHAYVTCYDHRTQLHFLLELTAAASEPLFAYVRDHGTTRQCGIKASRIPATINGRIHLQTQLLDPTRYQIPAAPRIDAILSRLWNIPLSEITTPDTLIAIPAITIATADRRHVIAAALPHQEGNGRR